MTDRVNRARLTLVKAYLCLFSKSFCSQPPGSKSSCWCTRQQMLGSTADPRCGTLTSTNQRLSRPGRRQPYKIA